MKLAILDLSKYNKFDQWVYILKEIEELKEAYINSCFNGNDETEDYKKEMDENLKSELWDVIQSCFGLLIMLDDVKGSNERHVEKLKYYESINRIPKIIDWIGSEV